jgi:fibrillarin-like rRNA methylase
MPKFLAGCHYNEEEISWHLKKKWDIGRSKLMATILQPVEVVKGQISPG